MQPCAPQFLGVMRRLLIVLVCSLAAHGVVYRSFLPHDAVHGYLGWYEAVVGVLSAAALAVLGLMLVSALVGKQALFRALTRPSSCPRTAGRHALSLIVASLAVLVAQEGLERRLAASPQAPALPDPGACLVAAVVIVMAALLFVVLEHSCSNLVRTLLARRTALPRAPIRPARSPSAPRHPRRRNSLADFRGLRAPPLTAS